MFFTLAVYAIIGIATRTAQVSEYYVAGRRVPAFYNGMATGADWMSAASFVAMAGSLFLQGYDGLAWVLGWTGGFVLVSILVGPYLRKFGAYTVPDFLSFRYGGNFARFLGVIVLVCCSFTYVTAQVFGTGIIASRFLGMQFELAVFAGLVGILACAMLGGMRAVTWTQIAQYIVLIVAYLVPIVILSTQHYGIPIPELTYGTGDRGNHGARAGADQIRPGGVVHGRGLRTDDAQAAHPAVHELHAAELLRHHLLHDGRHGVAAAHPDALLHDPVGEAGTGLGGVVAALHLPPVLLGAGLRGVLEARGLHQHHRQGLSSSIRPWLFTWGELGLIKICGADAVSLDAIMAACKKIANHPGVLRFQDFSINTDVIVLSTPEIAGLPYVISGLVAAGGLAAALSTADGLLLAIANALSHDVYYKMIQPLEDKKRTIVISAIAFVVVAGLFWFTAIPSPLFGIQWRWLLLGGLAVLVAVVFPFWGKANDVEKRLIIARALLAAGGGRGGLAGLDQAVGHPGDGGLGVLARHGRKLPGAHPRHLVETCHHDGRHLRDHRRLGHLPVLPRDLAVLPAGGRDLFRDDVAAQPGDGAGSGRRREDHGRSEVGSRTYPRARRTRWPTGSAGSTSTTSTAASWGCRSASW